MSTTSSSPTSSSDFPGVDQGVQNVGVDTMDHSNDNTFFGHLSRLNVHLHTKLGLDKCLYDLLESTRVVHRNCSVLHRDISTGNIMSRDLIVPPSFADLTDEHKFDENTDNNDEADDPSAIFCGSTYLLGETDDRSFTKNILIDLERADVLDQKEGGQRLPRMGTLQFMARVIREGRLLGDELISTVFVSPPEVSKAVAKRYGGALQDRLKRFNCKAPIHQPPLVYNPSATSARHALRHDAESVFWVSMWWAVCAAPAGQDASSVPRKLWVNLTDSLSDDRPLKLRDGSIDPLYTALQSLLNKLGTFLKHDLHWAVEAPYNHPEFLHEAFQRIILNFLVDNESEDFMLLPTSGKSRECQQHSRPELLLRTSSAAHGGSSRKHPASSQGELEVSPMLLH